MLHVFKDPKSACAKALWLASLFLIYRIGFAFSPEQAGTCKCFGVGTLFAGKETLGDPASIIVLFLLLVPGTILLVLARRPHTASVALSRSSAGTTGLAVTGAILAAFVRPNLLAGEIMFTPLYTAQGLVTFETLDQQGTTVFTSRFPFEIARDHLGRWQISRVMRFPQWDAVSKNYISYDGTNIFSVLYGDKALDRNNHPVSNTPFKAHSHPAMISRGPFPTDYGNVVGLLWLVFLGGDYVTGHPDSRIPDLLETSARTDPLAWACDFDYQLHSASRVPLLQSGGFRINQGRLSTDLMDFPEIEEPTTKGLQAMQSAVRMYVEATNREDLIRSSFSIDEVVHTDSLTVPRRFTGLLYLTHYQAGSPHYVVNRSTGEVTNWVAHPNPKPLLPRLVGVDFNVQDKRFMVRTRRRFMNARWYKLGHGGWTITTNDPRVSGGPGGVPPLQPRASVTGRNAIYYFFVTMGVMALAALLLIALWRRTHRRI